MLLDDDGEPWSPPCGSVPARYVGKVIPVAGCGKRLAGEDIGLVMESSQVTKTMLCNECFTKYREQK